MAYFCLQLNFGLSLALKWIVNVKCENTLKSSSMKSRKLEVSIFLMGIHVLLSSYLLIITFIINCTILQKTSNLPEKI